ncbi:MAG: electron transfer flavoprotein-ubiquinone oxidoreductase [Gammaproteobacteria bacterium]
MSNREAMEVDVVIVGAGPSGLAAACRLGQLCRDNNVEPNIVVVEKGSEVGAHILSGAVMDPRSMNELFPNAKAEGCPFNSPVTGDEVWFMTSAEKGMAVPHAFVPPTLHNDGNQVISLGNVCRWLGQQAEALGIQIFPGFAASEVLFNDDGSVKGIATGDMGIGHNGEKKASYAPGMELHAKYTIFAEGCRGHLGKQLIAKFGLDKNSGTQHYGIGIKELWDIDPAKHKPGLVIHTMGWPLTESGSSGGGFLYHLENNQVTLGMVVDLSYSNPHLSPFDEMQRWKTHPEIRKYLEGGKRISYGARAINKGGWQAIPKLVFPGGMLSGCDAGFMNFPRIKGSHTAMKTGMLAAEAVFAAIQSGDTGGKELTAYPEAFAKSWVAEELYAARNVAPAMHKFGTLIGLAFTFVDQTIFKGKLPFTLQDPIPDHATLKPAASCPKINYPKPDGKISFAKLDSVFLSNTNHEEDQPCHLQLKDPSIPLAKNLPLYDEPAQRYCPAGVYEIVQKDGGEKKFQINAQNCVHCKTCDIKDPAQNINWVVPEGGGGPNYPNM